MEKRLLFLITISCLQINAMDERPIKRQKKDNLVDNNNIMCDFETKKTIKTKLTANEKLFLAVKKENIEAMQTALKEGACINAKDEDEHTCLTLAATLGNLPITKFLIENGADMEITRLQSTFSFYHNDPTKITFDEENLTPLMLATQNNYIELSAFLASKCKFKKEIVKSINIATQYKHQEIKAILNRQKCLNNSLFEAITNNKLYVVNKLLKDGANIKYYFGDSQLTPLSHAIDNESSISIIKLLLKYDPSIINLISDNRTALFSTILLDNKKKRTYVFHSTDDNEPCIVKLLINNKADVNIAGEIAYENYATQASPLMLAVLNNRIDIAALLIWNGADLNFQDNEGHTILELIEYILKGFVSEEKIIADKYESVLFAIDPITNMYYPKDFKDIHNLLKNAETMKKISRKKIIDKIVSATPLFKDLAEIPAQYLI